MIRSRLGFRALVLSSLVLGLMAFATSAAQAEPGATWSVIKNDENKTLITIPDAADLLPQLVIKELEGGTAALLFVTKSGTHVEILCTVAKFAEGGLMQAGGGISGGKVLFTGCLVILNGKLAPSCHPHSPTKGEESKEILSEKGKGLIRLDVGNDLVKITPEVGLVFAVIRMGELCAIGEEVKVETTEAGEGLWIKDGGGNAGFLAEEPEHLILEGLNKLKALGQPAKIVGSAWITLGGVHAGLKWAGKPA